MERLTNEDVDIMARLTNEDVANHWIGCFPDELEDREQEATLIRKFLTPYESWILIEEDIETILTYYGTILMGDYFFKEKVRKFVENPIESVPPIILMPIDRENKNIFMLKKYNDPKVKWQIADGYHRIEALRARGFTRVKAFVPI